MKYVLATTFLVVLLTYGFACSRADEGADDEKDESPLKIAEPLPVGYAPPPLSSQLPPQPPGPEPRTVPSLPQPVMRMPMPPKDGKMDLAGAKAKSQFFAMDSRNPIVNGSFERWEKPGPIYWSGNFTYKKPEDPPDPDIQMFPSTWDGEWALRFLAKNKYVELYQDVTLPELEGAPVLEVVAYLRNPIPKEFAMRVAYVADGQPQVAEVYPSQTDGSWTWYHATIELPLNVAPGSVRLYLTREPLGKGNVILDGLLVRVVGARGASAVPQA